jgi:hypothetical protein
VPIYRVTVTIDQASKVRLIEAKTEAGALKYAAKTHIVAEGIRTAEQLKEMAELAAKGVKVETADAAD